MAQVFRARHKNLQRDVALKILSTELTRDESFCQRFLHEARTIAKLSHPHIIQVFDVGVDEGLHYIAMEHLAGGDLNERIKAGLDHDSIIRVLIQIASALGYAHQKGLVHRDIKPDNILFRNDNTAILTDFGIAKDYDSNLDLTQIGMMVGTPKYMSPEMIKGQLVGPPADLYSLGVVLFKMLTGDIPYQATDPHAMSMKHLNEPIPRLSPEHASFQVILDKMLAKNVEERYQTGFELIQDLERLTGAQLSDVIAFDATVVLPKKKVTASGVNASLEPTYIIEIPKKKASMMGATAGLAAAVVATLSWYMFAGGDHAESNSYLSVNSPVVAHIAEQIERDAYPVQIDSAQIINTKVRLLLLDAEQNMAQRQYSKPASNSALSKYRAVLALIPDQKDALQGIDAITQAYQQLARNALVAGRLVSAANLIGQLKEVAPDSPLLVALSDTLSQKQRAKQQAILKEKKKILSIREQLQIDGLLRNAQIDLEEGWVLEPKGNNAFEKYQKVLAIDPDNKQARAKLKEIKAMFRT